MAEFTNKQKFAEEQLAERDLFFLNLLIDALCGASQGDWEKPWLKAYSGNVPQSISGHQYRGMNALVLWLAAMVRNYTTPVYITRDKARKMGLKIKPDAPIEYITKTVCTAYYATDREAAKDAGLPTMISPSAYEKLSKEEQAFYNGAYRIMGWQEYNICNTNLQEVYPELYERILARFTTEAERDDSVRIKVASLDKMIAEQSWICPVIEDRMAEAFYACSATNPCIRLPKKADFVNDERYYGTLVHEMIHSTMVEPNFKGDPIRNVNHGDLSSYAREELVAEIGSAMVLCELGINPSLSRDNEQYLQHWFDHLGAMPVNVEIPNPSYVELLGLLDTVSPERDLSPVLQTLGTEELSLGQALRMHGLSYDIITPAVQELLERQETERIPPTVTVTRYAPMTKEALMSEEGQTVRTFLASVVADASHAADIVFSKGMKVELSEIREKGEEFVVEKEVDMSKKREPWKKKAETTKKKGYSRRK